MRIKRVKKVKVTKAQRDSTIMRFLWVNNLSYSIAVTAIDPAMEQLEYTCILKQYGTFVAWQQEATDITRTYIVIGRGKSKINATNDLMRKIYGRVLVFGNKNTINVPVKDQFFLHNWADVDKYIRTQEDKTNHEQI